MKHLAHVIASLLALSSAHSAEVRWLVEYAATSAPAAPWKAVGKPVAEIKDGALNLKDDSKDETGAFEAEWSGDLAGKEIVVETKVRLVSMVGHRDSPVATWPQRDGAPVCIEISDGSRVEGMLLTPPAYRHAGAAPGYVRTLTDRFAQADTEASERRCPRRFFHHFSKKCAHPRRE